jgi:hypothetical protein
MGALPKTVFILTLALLVAGGVAADQTGEIRGTVSDVSEAPLPGVVITAKGPNLQGQRNAV